MDYFLFQKINELAGQWAYLDAAGIFFAKYFGYVFVGLVFLLFWSPRAGARRAVLSAFLSAIIARFIIVELIRWLWQRPRPFVENHITLLLEKTNEASFPSGHAAFYFAIAAVVYFYNKKIGLLFLIAAFFISVGRVFSGLHWPSDILAGALVGIFSGWLVVNLAKRFGKK